MNDREKTGVVKKTEQHQSKKKKKSEIIFVKGNNAMKMIST
jgi:hypothetical protein